MNKRWICFLMLCIATIPEAMAQGCAVCTKTAAGLGDSSAHGLNSGILYLAAIPVLFMIIVGIIWYKRTKASGEDEPISFRY